MEITSIAGLNAMHGIDNVTVAVPEPGIAAWVVSVCCCWCCAAG
jgi:hypothetical protein